jgi:hypothetical protein
MDNQNRRHAAGTKTRRTIVWAAVSCMSLPFLVGSSAIAAHAAESDQPTPAPTPAVAGHNPAPPAQPTSHSHAVGGSTVGSTPQPNGITCTWGMDGDNAHLSANGLDASQHSWWYKGNCNATQAKITIQMQEYYSDGTWRNKGAAIATTVGYAPPNGTRPFANGRTACTSVNNGYNYYWRAEVDVDVINIADDPDKDYFGGPPFSCLA